jgi:hypothetical protein
MAERFEDLEAWRTARELTKVIFTLTEKEKFSRDYSLKDQIRRASVSAMSNVAEGFESRTQNLMTCVESAPGPRRRPKVNLLGDR